MNVPVSIKSADRPAAVLEGGEVPAEWRQSELGAIYGDFLQFLRTHTQRRPFLTPVHVHLCRNSIYRQATCLVKCLTDLYSRQDLRFLASAMDEHSLSEISKEMQIDLECAFRKCDITSGPLRVTAER